MNSASSQNAEVRTFDTDRAETEHVADLLRRAHLEDGIAWDRMAVLVRSGRTSIPPLRRALAAAGRGNHVPILQLGYSNLFIDPETEIGMEDPAWYGAAGELFAEAADDEEIKLLAINALVHTDPERALPLLEGVLNGGANSALAPSKRSDSCTRASVHRARPRW